VRWHQWRSCSSKSQSLSSVPDWTRSIWELCPLHKNWGVLIRCVSCGMLIALCIVQNFEMKGPWRIIGNNIQRKVSTLHSCYLLLTVLERRQQRNFCSLWWRRLSSNWARNIHESHLLYTICNLPIMDWGRGIQEITTCQLWGVCVRKVCVMPYAYCEEVFRFKPWRSYRNFHILERTSVKASILQTWCVQDCVAECNTTENFYLLLTI
jgi:hypothetical protein